MKYRLVIILFLWSMCLYAQQSLPCIGTTTARLYVRSGPGKQYKSIVLLDKGSQVKVVEKVNTYWVKVEYANTKGYAHANYLKFSPLPIKKNQKDKVSSFKLPKMENSHWLWSIVKVLLGVLVFYFLSIFTFKIISFVLYLYLKIIKTASVIYYPFNWLQRFLQKPWYIFIKKNRFSDSTNQILRFITILIKIPLYIISTPLRFANAVFYNLIIHCAFEMYNYTMEVLYPSSADEGKYSPRIFHLFIWRIIKYPIGHGMLTIFESLIWTAIDTLLPALTLYHGTSREATSYIVSSYGFQGYASNGIRLWMVGGGNFAGNGIYFAPAYSTACHYSQGIMIICRVTLGSTIDLGLAPRYVYNQCGHPNATDATRWGLNNGYVTGKWWREDSGWWEYCMYDWQNRYNESWRIRPLHLIDLDNDNEFVRFERGMHHWLFRWIVLKDMTTSLCKSIQRLFN